MEKTRLYYLVDRWLSEEITRGELVELDHLMESGRVINEVENYIQSHLDGAVFNFGPDTGKLAESILDKTKLTVSQSKPSPIIVLMRRGWVRYVAAAVIVLFVTAGIYYLHNSHPIVPVQTAVVNDVTAPGSTAAKLIFANGTRIVLDSLQTGTSVAGAIKTKEGLAYNKQDGEAAYHTLLNPRGSKPVSVVLADGTTVWLNAASSITFPTVFNGPVREVSMTGEAFFDVVHIEKQPFHVKAGDQLIEDIGTSFNINAYDDEQVLRTTIVKGAASVRYKQGKVLITAGEKAELLRGKLEKGKGDVEQALAWRNNLFSFSHAGIPEMMRQISRWYDVEVVYQGNVPDETFTGDIGRTLTLAQVLTVLKKMSAHFSIEDGRKIIIRP